jgi:hypothetical protein
VRRYFRPQTGVTLEANGGFTIDDVLSPAPPNPCDSPVLLLAVGGITWLLYKLR